MRDAVARSAPFGLVELSNSGVVIDANEIFARWFVPIVPAVVGERLSDLFGITEAELAAALQLTTGGTGLVPSTTIVRPPGVGSRPLILASNRLENGNISVAIVDASRPQAEPQRAEAAQAEKARAETVPAATDAGSRRESENLQLLLAASVRFANSTSASELAEILADAARHTFRADWSSVHLAEGEDFSFVGGHNPLVERWPLEAPPTGARTMQLGQVITITDPADAEQYLSGVGIAGVMEDSGVHSILVAPITEHGTPIGTVACYFAGRRTFDDQAEPLIRSLAQHAGQVFARLRLEEKLRRSAMLDEITGLPNRRLFEQQFRGTARSAAIVFLDLDGFKKVNDELGHATGDMLLSRVAHRLRGVFRQTDSVARYGGDEFVATIETSTEDGAVMVAERARAAIAESFPELPAQYRITASIGVAVDATPSGGAPVERLIRIADRAMYTAKAAGGNRVECEYLR